MEMLLRNDESVGSAEKTKSLWRDDFLCDSDGRAVTVTTSRSSFCTSASTSTSDIYEMAPLAVPQHDVIGMPPPLQDFMH